MQREIINHRSLRHPNIVRFKEVCTAPLSYHFSFPAFEVSKSELPNITMWLSIGHIDTNTSGYRDGICFWRRAIWTNMQCWAVQWGWGSYFWHYNINHAVPQAQQSYLIFIVFCCRLVSFSNNLYPGLATVMQWYKFWSFCLIITSSVHEERVRCLTWISPFVFFHEASLPPRLEVGEHSIGW